MSTINPSEIPAVRDQGAAYLSAADRVELYDSRAQLFVVSARPRVEARGDFGEQVSFAVVSPGRWRDQPRLLALAWTEPRSALARDLSQRLARGGPGDRVGPFMLGKRTTRAGHEVWNLEAYQPGLAPSVDADAAEGDR